MTRQRGATNTMSDNEGRLEVSVGGRKTVVHPGSMTGRDVRDFRAEVGMPPRIAFTDPDAMDIDIIAAFVWIERRKARSSLSYGEVLDEMSYDNVDVTVVGSDDEDEASEADDPEG